MLPRLRRDGLTQRTLGAHGNAPRSNAQRKESSPFRAGCLHEAKLKGKGAIMPKLVLAAPR